MNYWQLPSQELRKRFIESFCERIIGRWLSQQEFIQDEFEELLRAYRSPGTAVADLGGETELAEDI